MGVIGEEEYWYSALMKSVWDDCDEVEEQPRGIVDLDLLVCCV